MTRKIGMATLAITALLASGCTQEGDSGAKGDKAPAAVVEGEVIATVNGAPITEETLTMIKQANRGARIPREKLIDELIKHELLFQEAERKKLDQNEDIANRLKFIRRSILSQAAMQDFIANNQISDEQIKKEYDAQSGTLGGTEYKARHILTKDQEKAKEVIQKLKDGGKFEELAKEYSIGPTGAKGGDLGWFSPQQMVPPFSAAVVELKDGEHTANPVKTQFGWHVILREGSRDKALPPLEKVKAGIQQKLSRQAIEDHLAALRSGAEVVIIEKKPETPPAPPVAPKPEPAAEKPAADSAAPASAETGYTAPPPADSGAEKAAN